MVYDPGSVDAFLNGKRAIAIGMGWGSSEENQRILKHALECYEGALVIDADGLNALSKLDRAILKSTNARVILTPHLKEFERISGVPMGEILQNPVQYAKDYAKENGVCLLLKGACTVVTDGDACYLVDRGCAGMATAGSGDVLSGILAGLLGYSPATVQAVACGAYLAGLAGELAEAETNPISMTASDTVAHISKAIDQLRFE